MKYNLGDLEFDLSSSLKAKSNCAICLSIYDFLLRYKSKHMSNTPFDCIAAQEMLTYLLSLGQHFGPPTPTLILVRVF